MAYQPDLAPLTYSCAPQPHVLAVGWLDAAAEYPRGVTSIEFREVLLRLISSHRMRLFRGSHLCNLCPEGSCVRDGKMVRERTGNGEIRVRKGDKWYVAPVLVHHYITEHGYRPPDEFIEAVLKPSQIGSDEDR